MKINKITLTNLKVPGEQSYDGFKDLNIIRGGNASGKTAILEGIRLSLTGALSVGKTNPAIMQLSCGDTMSVDVEAIEGGRLFTQGVAFKRSDSGRIARSGIKAGAATMIDASEYTEAANKGRFAMLASVYKLGGAESEAGNLEGVIADLSDKIKNDRLYHKRLSASLKTTLLELSKIEEHDNPEALLGRRDRALSRVAVCRAVIAKAAAANCNDDRQDEAVNVAMTEEAMEAEIIRCEAICRDMKAKLALVPDGELERREAIVTNALAEHREALAIHEEWSKSFDKQKAKDLEAEAARLSQLGATIDMQVSVLQSASANGEICKCPVCGSDKVDNSTLESLIQAGTTNANLLSEVLASLDGLQAPITQADLDRTHKAMVTAQESRDKLRAIAAEVDPEACKNHSINATTAIEQLKAALSALRGNALRREAKGAREELETLREWLNQNEQAIADIETRARLTISARTGETEVKRCEEAIAEAVEQKKAAEAKYNAECAGFLKSILASASGFLDGIVDGEVIAHGSEIFIRRDGARIPWAAMSGSEQLAIGAAIKTELSTVNGILMVDEIGVLTDQARIKFMENVKAALAHGRIDQAFIVLPSDGFDGVDIEHVESGWLIDRVNFRAGWRVVKALDS